MSLNDKQAKALRAAIRERSRPALKRLFATIRAKDDRVLLAAIRPAKKRTAKRKGDPLARDLDQALKPILGPAPEKADMLVEHLAKKHRRKLTLAPPKGLADAVRQLRAKKFTDEQIRAGAKSLVAHLAKLHGRETVV